MNKSIYTLIFIGALLVSAIGCRKQAWDEKYNRPAGLENPIYQVLDARGNFKNLLALITKGGYKETLTGAGYWTMFAPNDAAFTEYFKDKGIAGVESIDSTMARAMVQYWLIYNAYQKDRMDDYQATANNAGWTPATAFRRRTAYYTGFYKDTGYNNKEIVAIANNRNSPVSSLTGNYVTTDYNNKYITYFTDDYFKANNLSATDYKYFYPNSEYTGFNVLEARIVNKDIITENGVVHEVDKVITPLLSIEEYIKTRPEYSSFRSILNRLYTNNMVRFIYNQEASHRYQILTGKSDSVFVKVYSGLLAFAPNNENFLKAEENDGQKDNWTLFIPNNAAVDKYVKDVLLENYPSFDQMPSSIIADFLNAHMFPTAVWPTKFSVTRNTFTEPARFNANVDVFDRKILSNGFVYGTTKVQEPDVFRTVYSKAYLHPKYSMMTRLFNLSPLKPFIASSSVPVNICLIPDAVFAAEGFTYNATNNTYAYKGSSNGAVDRIMRIASTCMFFDPYKPMIENLSGNGIVKSGVAGTEGDYIKFSNNTIITAGLMDAGKVAKVDSVKTAVNGKVYYLDQLPLYSEKPIGTHIASLGAASTSDFNLFYQYLLNSPFVYNPTTTDIIGVTGFSTILIPDNVAMRKAVNDGLLPGTGTAPNKTPTFNPTNDKDRDLVRKFIQYHIISAHTVVPDGTTSGFFETYSKDAEGNAIRVKINSTPGIMNIVDNNNRTANVILSKSNNLSNRSVIHLIDNYLNYLQ